MLVSSGSALCQVTWFVHLQEIPEDSMPAAVNNMVDALLQAGLALLRDDRSLDQAYFAQLLLLFRVSVTVSHALIALGGAVCIVSAIIAYSLLCQEEASGHCRQACCWHTTHEKRSQASMPDPGCVAWRLSQQSVPCHKMCAANSTSFCAGLRLSGAVAETALSKFAPYI